MDNEAQAYRVSERQPQRASQSTPVDLDKNGSSLENILVKKIFTIKSFVRLSA